MQTPIIKIEGFWGQVTRRESESKCEIFVDIEIEGLSLIHLSVSEMPGESRPVSSRLTYQYDVKANHVVKPMHFSEKVHLEDKTLALKEVNRFIQRSLGLTFDSGTNDSPLDFEFSIESKSNQPYDQLTGHYMMTVKEQQNPFTNQTMIIEKIDI